MRNNAIEYFKSVLKAFSYNPSVDKYLLGFKFSVYIAKEQALQTIPK